MSKTVRSAAIAGMLVGILGLGTTKAEASSVQYNFNVSNGFGGAGSAPFGRLTLTEFGTNDILVIVELFNNLQFVSAFSLTVGFNLDGIASVTYSGVPANWTIPNEVGTDGQNAGSYNVDGFGNFEYGISGPGSGGSDPQPSPLVFHVIATGITLNSFIELSSGGSPSAYFVADVIGSGPGASTGAIAITAQPRIVPTCLEPPCTGELPDVPEPGTLVLLGAGLALVAMRLRRKSA